MEALFIKLLNMSIIAGWLILLILLFRRVFKQAPKWMNYFLWGIVAFRLICPVSMESVMSLIPSQETVPQSIVYEQQPAIESGSVTVNNIVNPVISTMFEATPEYSVNPIQIAIFVASHLWILGVVVLAIYAVASFLRLNKRVEEAVWVEDNIWRCDHIETAFILGIIRPRIFIPSSIGEEQMAYVVAHEKSHIEKKDHWWKPFGFALLTVYWFNPLIWIAYIALCKDIELACDERVIKNMDGEEKKAYSTALLECSVSEHMISACPVAFGEVGVERRVKTVLNYKKPGFWITVVGVLICIVAAIGFLTNPATGGNKETNVCGTYVFETIADHRYNDIYLILQEDGVFVGKQAIDPNTLDGVQATGTYEKEDDRIILQLDKENYILNVNGDELVFENTEEAEKFAIDFWGVQSIVEDDSFLRISSHEMIESGCPEDVVKAMDSATKDRLMAEGWYAPITYWECYFEKDGTYTSYKRHAKVSYQEPENMDEYVLKLTLMVTGVGHEEEHENYYESKLDGVTVICFYEWLQPPSSFDDDYKMQLSWSSNMFQMKDDGFVKIDKYVLDGKEYIYSYEPGYAEGSPFDVSWYTEVKGTMGAEPERLYGCAIIELETTMDVGDLNMNVLLEYETKNGTVQALEEFSWEHYIIDRITE